MSDDRPKHHPTLSPSKLDALAECPCYMSGPAGEAAQKGTDQHAYAEALLRNEATPRTAFPLSAEDRDNVEWYVDYVRATATATANLEIEVAYELMGKDFKTVTWGTIDAAAGPDIFDYKSDREPRPHGRQMAAYALMRMQATGTPRITCHLCYGRLRKVDKLTYTVAEATALVNEIVAAVDPANDPHPKSCQYCGWCARALSCPALTRQVTKVAAQFDPERSDKLAMWSPTDVTDPSAVGRMLEIARIVSGWAETVDKHAKTMLESGVEVPGWTLLKRNGARMIADIPTAFSRTGLDEADFLKCCTVKIGELEEIYAARKGVKKAEAKRTLAAALEDITERKPDFHVLVKTKQQ